MTWVRFDDQFPLHRKIAPLDDATFRLVHEALSWCNRNVTDGRIAPDELETISKRATKRRAAALVTRDVWHTSDFLCASPDCPPPGPDGWTVHDYWFFQPRKEKVLADRAASAERTRAWRERRRNRDGVRDAPRDGVRDAVGNRGGDGVGALSPSRPVPSRPEGDGRRDVGKPCDRCGNAISSAYHRNVCSTVGSLVGDP